MKYQGKNLFISLNGIVIAGAKSCELTVNAEKIPIASSTDSQWEHVICGRKSWQVTSNHLVDMQSGWKYYIEALSASNSGTFLKNSYVIINGTNFAGGTRGIQMRIFEFSNGNWVMKGNAYQYDTYSDASLCATMITDLNTNATSDNLVAITTYDAYAMTSELAQAIATKLNIPVNTIPTMSARRSALVVIGQVGRTGIAQCSNDEGAQVHARLLMNNEHVAILRTPLRNLVFKTGEKFRIHVQVDELASDRLSGLALCTQSRVNATIGNLQQGGFQFAGDGPLS